MYESNVNDVLISCGGGELMCEILPYVDFDRIKAAKPKWYLGYSDNTNFTFLQNTIADTASVYGPCAGAFAMKDWHQALVDTFDVLRGKGCKNNNGVVEKQVHGYDTWERESLKNEENPAPQYNLTEKKILRKYVGGEEGLSAAAWTVLLILQVQVLTRLKSSMKDTQLTGLYGS